MIRHRASLLVLSFALAFAPWVAPTSSAQTSTQSSIAPAPASAASDVTTSGSEAPALARALDTIRADRILADIFYVACDDMGGRDTPSVGQRLTARFIKNRLQRLGWKPGAERGWFHTYPLAWKQLDESKTRVDVVKRGAGGAAEPGPALELGFARDYFFGSWDLETLDLRGEVVFCGTGSAEDLAASPAVKGKWALCYVEGRMRGLDDALRGAGAIGLLAAQPPGSGRDARTQTEDFGRTIASMRSGYAAWPQGESSEPRRFQFYPRLYLPKETTERLLALAGKPTPKAGDELGLELHDVRKLAGSETIQCENVCGWWPGSDPELSKETILVSAHYDHVGIGADGRVYNGADDNGSGTCGLLALAEALVAHGPLRRSVMLIWVSGEEKGLWGSAAWAKSPWLPDGAKAIANINIDMIGRNAPTQILLTPTKAHRAYNGLSKLAAEIAPLEGFTNVGSADEYYTRSDHANFAKLEIPITFLFSDVHADYHQPGDDPEKIDPDKTRRVVRMVLRMLADMQDDELVLEK